jgi:hypothetical protein
VTGRDALVADLVERLSQHRPTVLIGPRRYGKTSVLGRVAAELDDTVAVIEVDLYELRSWADFATRLDDALAGIPVRRRGHLDRLAAGLEINLGVVKASLMRPDRPAPDAAVDRLLDLLIAFARAQPVVVVFDEFSSIVRVDGAAGLLRTKLQRQYQHIGLVFAGSEPSTMRMLFADTDQPFYAQADLVEIPGLDLPTLTEIVDAGFEGAPPAGLAARIHDFTGGHPQRSMQLADAAWQVTRDPDVTDPTDVWGRALDWCRRSTDDGHELRFSGLTAADQAAMRLAATDGVLFGRDAELLSLSRSSAQAARRRLVDRGQIRETDGRVEVVDPLYADWIRRRFAL